MKTETNNKRVRISIDLSSRLIAEAIYLLLAGASDLFDIDLAMDASPFVGEVPPSMILLDKHTLGHDHHARWPEAKLVLIDTGLSEEKIVSILFSHKLCGIIATDTTPVLFVKALTAIHGGEIWIDNRKVKAVLGNLESSKKFMPHDCLSKREREIVILVSEGFRNRDIADRLCVSEQTVKTHINRIFRKYDVTCRTQLVPIAMKFRLSPTL